MLPIRFLPIAISASASIGLFGCLILSASLPHWWFGFRFPPFSVTGYDPLPCFVLFTAGLSVTGALCGWLVRRPLEGYFWYSSVQASLMVSLHAVVQEFPVPQLVVRLVRLVVVLLLPLAVVVVWSRAYNDGPA